LADYIEIWASDTHSIFDSSNNLINPERDIIINDNVWIGAHVIILKGVTIGAGSVVGIATLVTKNIPSNSLSVGNTNRVIRENISWNIDYKIQ
jgi:acetyltransferase-like isoleucine patch superfamily enzyme